MTVKPGWIGSLAAIVAFTALGGLADVVIRRGAEGGPVPDRSA